MVRETIIANIRTSTLCLVLEANNRKKLTLEENSCVCNNTKQSTAYVNIMWISYGRVLSPKALDNKYQ